MTCFSWLHLTDLHCGSKARDCLDPGEKEIFFKDLKELHDKCGSWDLVLLTGDLTHMGSTEEFERLDDFFEQLWEHFEKLGSDPKLLAVPGNHDLLRPAQKAPALRLLQQWNKEPDIQKEFWKDAKSPYRRVVAKAFANYTNWWEDHPFRSDNIEDGILPGDFTVTIEKNGAKLGILGLNSAFLQLSGDDYQRKLALHSRQFHEACGGDGAEWAKQHHTCLLLTHHSPDWLNPGARQYLNGEITAHGRFAVHLYGHLHEKTSRYNATMPDGVEVRRIWQGCSLFGLRFYEKGPQKQEMRRDPYGYSAGKIELREGNIGELTLWPRGIQRRGHQSGFVPDYSVNLTNERESCLETKFNLHYPFHTGKTPSPQAGENCIQCMRCNKLVHKVKENLNHTLAMIEKHSG